MFCENCGTNIGDRDKYCIKCGSAVAIKNNISKQDLPNDQPENKAWFRFLKVLYIIVYLVVMLGAIAISLVTKPHAVIDNNLSTIKCDNGNIYQLNKNNLYIYSDDNNLNDTADKHARILCKYDTLNYYSNLYSNENIPKNYTFNPVFINPNYSDWLWYSFVGLLILWLGLKLIKVTALYIILGSRSDWKKELIKII